MIKRIVKIFLFILLIFGIYKGIQIHHDVKQVMQYRSLVREVLAEEDTTANENLILAMIYTETKGREDDVMQASESASGETNTISDNKASIRQGIQTLSDELKEAKKKALIAGLRFKPIILGKTTSITSQNTVEQIPRVGPGLFTGCSSAKSWQCNR